MRTTVSVVGPGVLLLYARSEKSVLSSRPCFKTMYACMNATTLFSVVGCFVDTMQSPRGRGAYAWNARKRKLIMRRGRGSEATKAVFCLQAKKPLHSGSYEHRVPKIKDKTCFYMYVCVIQHRNWPLRSTILIAHGTNASPDGLCTRAHTNEAFSCWFCCN